MGAQPTKPEREEADELRKNVPQACSEAADAILEADVLLLATGAGWSAESGLAVYRDIANVKAYAERDLTYRELCVPSWLRDEPELFWGFWGLCFNDYRQTRPHDGYGLVKAWRDAMFSSSDVAEVIGLRVAEQEKQTSLEDLKNEEEAWSNDHVTPPGAFFSYTSNVDAHFYDVLDAGEIRECHGNVELYQCGGRRVVVEDEEEGEKVLYMSKKCSRSVWRAPSDLTPYAVSTDTMLAEDGARALSLAAKTDQLDKATIGHTGGTERDPTTTLQHMPPPLNDRSETFDKNWPVCPRCGGRARPAILMFEDNDWVDSAVQDRRYREWTAAVRWLATETRSASNPLRVVILEVGAGGNVTTVRHESEHVFRNVDAVATTLIRVNPELPLPDNDVDKLAAGRVRVLSVMTGGLDAVRRIDACLRERRPDLFDESPIPPDEAYTPLAGYEAIGEELGDIRLDE